ncbi:MAG: NAD(P)H-hydrate dehydratase [Candidatus Nitrotoga sp.]
MLKPQGLILNATLVKSLFPAPRLPNSHKGNYGSVGVLGGADGMVGAAFLAARAALKFGAGRVYVGLLAHHPPTVDLQQPELMLQPPNEWFKFDLSVLVAGPGLGISADAYSLLKRALEQTTPLILDADALNLVATHPDLAEILQKRSNNYTTLLTPHPGEAARLLGISTSNVQADRIIAAQSLAHRFNSYAVLKGADSICVMPSGEYLINTSGNPGLASAGTGDVLAGMIAALIAQGLTARDALLLAVYAHGHAADELVKNGIGPIGLTASELIDASRHWLNSKYGANR